MTIRSTERCRPGACALVAALAGLAAAAVVACTRVASSPSPPGVRRIVVLPVDDRTGSALYVDAPPLVSILRDDAEAERRTVSDLIADELRRQLVARGFEVVAAPASPGGAAEPVRSPEDAALLLRARHIDAAALYTRLSRWDPFDPSHVTYVDVAAEMTLVAADRERPIWRARLPASPIPAGGASSVSLAYPVLARQVVERLLGDLAPVRAAVPLPAP